MTKTLLLALCVAATLQGPRVPLNLTPAGPLQTAQEMSATVGKDSDAASLISKALVMFLRRQPQRPRTVTVLASQLPDEWLPSIQNVQFRRLDDDAMQSHYDSCGTFLWVSIQQSRQQMVATVSEGYRMCLRDYSSYRFSLTTNGWQFTPDRTGIIFGGFACECLIR
jgi:hypothetical protein